jgi:hypothetical protein
MKTLRLAAALLPFVISSPAGAAVIVDAAGDIKASFVATGSPDLDVTSFSVTLNPNATFSLGAVLAGEINPALAGFYVIGVNTGVALPLRLVGSVSRTSPSIR